MIIKHIYKSERWPDFRVGCRSFEDCAQLIRYLQRPNAYRATLHNDFESTSPTGIAGQIRELHSNQAVWAYHVMARFPKNETPLWEPQAGDRIRDLNQTFKIPLSYWVSHGDHWHGVLLGFKPLGGQVPLQGRSKAGKRLPVALALREMAEQWEDMTPGARMTGRDASEGSYSRECLAMAVREYAEGKSLTPLPKKMHLKADVGRLVSRASSFPELERLAKEAGIEIKKREDAGVVQGISFARDGVAIRGRDAGFSYKQLMEFYECPRTTSPNQHVATRTFTRNSHRNFKSTPARVAGIEQTTPSDRGCTNESLFGLGDILTALAGQPPRIMQTSTTLIQILELVTWTASRLLNSKPIHHDRYPKRTIT